MKATDVIEVLRNNLESAKEAGTHSIPIERFAQLVEELKWLDSNTPEGVSNDEQAVEWYRAKLADRNARWSARRDLTYSMVQLTTTSGLNALKVSTLINGGAAVALIALLGSLYESKQDSPIPVQLVQALTCFGGGVFLSAIASGATYFSQACFGGEFGSISAARAWRKAAIAATAMALFFFPVGAWRFALAFLNG